MVGTKPSERVQGFKKVNPFKTGDPGELEFPIAEIFRSIQGEGYWTGIPATFIRLAGCNLHCEFCDTDHRKRYTKSIPDIMAEVPSSLRHVVVTGGEPLMHPNLSCLLRELDNREHYVQVETNGMYALSSEATWYTVSPKYHARAKLIKWQGGYLAHPSEVKVVYTGEEPIEWLESLDSHSINWYFLQPVDIGGVMNIKPTLSILGQLHKRGKTKWRLSLQTQKFLEVR